MLYEHVPPYMGALHQTTALLVLSQILRTIHTLRTPVPGAGALALSKAIGPLALAGAGGVAVTVTTQN